MIIRSYIRRDQPSLDETILGVVFTGSNHEEIEGFVGNIPTSPAHSMWFRGRAGKWPSRLWSVSRQRFEEVRPTDTIIKNPGADYVALTAEEAYRSYIDVTDELAWQLPKKEPLRHVTINGVLYAPVTEAVAGVQDLLNALALQWHTPETLKEHGTAALSVSVYDDNEEGNESFEELAERVTQIIAERVSR